MPRYAVYDHLARELWAVVEADSPLNACHAADALTGDEGQQYRITKHLPKDAQGTQFYEVSELPEDEARYLDNLYWGDLKAATHWTRQLIGIAYKRVTPLQQVRATMKQEREDNAIRALRMLFHSMRDEPNGARQ